MPEGLLLATGDGFSIAEVHCPGGRARFDPPEVEFGHVLVTARRGVFIRRVHGREDVIDGTGAYLSAPGMVEQFAHPVTGGDICAVVHFDPWLIAALGGGDPDLAHPALPMDAASEFAPWRASAWPIRPRPPWPPTRGWAW